MAVYRLDSLSHAFPPPEYAEREPNGLLAIGGDLSPERLLAAYQQGIFPWFGDGDPLLWWSPDPRAVLQPDDLHLSRSLSRQVRRTQLQVRSDTAFTKVIEGCAEQRSGETWITPEMIDAYCALHRTGHAHSIEVYADSELVGGLYGVAVGAVFCGESMFHRRSGASKLAFVSLATTLFAEGWRAIDCQLPNAHLGTLGVREIPRTKFLHLLQECSSPLPWPDRWRLPFH